MDMLRHPEFDIKDMRSDTIIHLLRRLERPFKESAVQVYNLWKEKDGNQRLELVVRDFRETFIEIMRNPEWAQHFDLTSRPDFRSSVLGVVVGAYAETKGGWQCYRSGTAVF